MENKVSLKLFPAMEMIKNKAGLYVDKLGVV